MTAYIAPGLASCDQCFVCHECERRVCAATEVVLCAHGDDPTCGVCCDEYHGDAS
jgi:hypothetical protein